MSSFSFFFSFLLAFSIYVTTETRVLHKWNKPKITWQFDDPYLYLTPQQYKVIRNIAKTSFDEWSTALQDLLVIEEFEQDLDGFLKPDITIYFAKKNHSCVESFDGRGGVVAHSTYPSKGMLHLDGDELWHTGDPSKGDVDIRYVLIHEIGHVLGLRHSRKRESVMRKNYRSTTKQFHLSKYDVRAIRKLYEYNT